MRYLGLDFGEKRIGVAVSDDAGRLAVTVGTVRRKNDYEAIGELRELARTRSVEALVVGLPKHLDGRPGTLAERICRFSERLARACEIELFYADEALTSHEAQRLLAANVARDGDTVDSQAARILLQSWLDQGPPP